MQAIEKDTKDATKARDEIKALNKQLADVQRKLLGDTVKDKKAVTAEAEKY